jgi:hypothetical protein
MAKPKGYPVGYLRTDEGQFQANCQGLGEGMKLYRFLSADDTSAFCHKVTAALNKGWELHGSPTYAFDAANGVMRCGQAVVKEVAGDYHPELKLGEQ